MSNEERVKEKWPLAYVYYNTLFGHFSIFATPHNVVGRGKTESEAWESAASKIDKKEGI